MTLAEFAREMERIAVGMPDVALETAGWAQEQAFARAVALSGGGHSSADLARMDHPYARRHGAPQLDPSVINVQSGQFRAAWEKAGPSQVGDTVVASVFNADDPVAGYLEQGTAAMFERPLTERVTAELEPRLEQHFAAALAALMGD